MESLQQRSSISIFLPPLEANDPIIKVIIDEIMLKFSYRKIGVYVWNSAGDVVPDHRWPKMNPKEIHNPTTRHLFMTVLTDSTKAEKLFDGDACFAGFLRCYAEPWGLKGTEERPFIGIFLCCDFKGSFLRTWYYNHPLVWKDGKAAVPTDKGWCIRSFPVPFTRNGYYIGRLQADTDNLESGLYKALGEPVPETRFEKVMSLIKNIVS
jgi:hypothetical protein